MNIYKKKKKDPVARNPVITAFNNSADVFQEKDVTFTVNEVNGVLSLETHDEIKKNRNGLKTLLGFGNKRDDSQRVYRFLIFVIFLTFIMQVKYCKIFLVIKTLYSFETPLHVSELF